jgi:hypothetical protein
MPLKKLAGQTTKTYRKAKKPALYTPVLNTAEQLDFKLAFDINGMDDEIALLRLKLKSVLVNDPDNIKQNKQLTGLLARLLKTRSDINKDNKNGIKEAFETVFKEVALPLGIGIRTGIKKQ